MATVTEDRGDRSLRARNRLGDRAFEGISFAFGLTVILSAVVVLFGIITQAWPALTTIGLGILGSQVWDANHNIYGALAFVYGTVVTSLLALLLSGAVGIMIAIFLVELAPPLLSRPISFLVEMLAAVPSIIYGLWGIFVLIPLLIPVEDWLNQHLGFIPLFGDTPSPSGSILIASIVLAIMILPTIAAISRDVMAAVPGSQREGILALGATKWEMVRKVVIPYARAGIIGAAVLGLGRAVGETMAVTMVIGNDPHIHASLLAPGYSLAAVLANEAGDTVNTMHISALFELGLLLFLISIALNVLARVLVWSVNRGTARGQRR
jgi:phosphate transport system permease protein